MTITWTLKISKFHSCVFGNLSLNISITYEWLFPYLGLILSIKFIIIYLRLCKMITLRIHVEAMERIKNYHILDLARTIVASARVIALSTSVKKSGSNMEVFSCNRILLSVKVSARQYREPIASFWNQRRISTKFTSQKILGFFVTSLFLCYNNRIYLIILQHVYYV